MDDEEVSKSFFKLGCPSSIWTNYEMSQIADYVYVL